MLSSLLIPDGNAHFSARDDRLRCSPGNLGCQADGDVFNRVRMRDILRNLSCNDTDVRRRTYEYAMPSIFFEAET